MLDLLRHHLLYVLVLLPQDLDRHCIVLVFFYQGCTLLFDPFAFGGGEVELMMEGVYFLRKLLTPFDELFGLPFEPAVLLSDLALLLLAVPDGAFLLADCLLHP